ncbi:MAG: transcriptional regulator [Deltaproteobacteria bacterium]|nr:transcriptional regulator [Deltaproteobacteria bacterium]
MYDTRDSRYVTLDQISEMIRQGEDVKVVDNATKEDLTSVTLAQILFEEEKRQRSFLPLAALRNIIQSGGDSLHGLMNQLSESATRVFRREEQQERGGDAQGPIERRREESFEPTAVMREFVEHVQGAIDTWQRRIESNINHAVESVSPFAPLQKELAELRQRMGELERKLEGR